MGIGSSVDGVTGELWGEGWEVHGLDCCDVVAECRRVAVLLPLYVGRICLCTGRGRGAKEGQEFDAVYVGERK